MLAKQLGKVSYQLILHILSTYIEALRQVPPKLQKEITYYEKQNKEDKRKL